MPSALTLFLVGLVIACPIGPLTVIAVRRALLRGLFSGFSIGIGCSIADNIICVLIFYGLQQSARIPIPHVLNLQFLGGLICVGTGLYFMLRPVPVRVPRKTLDAGSGVALGFLMTAINPTNMISIAAIISAFNIHPQDIMAVAISSVLIFAGSVTAWLGVIYAFCRLLRGTNPQVLEKGRGITGAILVVLGAVIVLRSLF